MFEALERHMASNGVLSPMPKPPSRILNCNKLLRKVVSFGAPYCFIWRYRKGLSHHHDCPDSCFT
ncbi:hypothetical protein BDW66DRAFT_131710 [Aspergillus desertorum]